MTNELREAVRELLRLLDQNGSGQSVVVGPCMDRVEELLAREPDTERLQRRVRNFKDHLSNAMAIDETMYPGVVDRDIPRQ